MKKLFFCWVLLCFFLVGKTQEGVQFVKEDWATVLKQAKSQNKLVFLDAYTTWCAPCKKMDKEVFPLKNVGEFYNKNFVSIKMDMEKGEGKALAEKYKIVAFPTFLYVNPQGEVLHREAGYRDDAEMIALGEKALSPENRLSAMDDRYENGDRDPEFLLKYIEAKFIAADKSHLPVVAAYLNTQDDWLSEKNIRFIHGYMENADSPTYNFMLEHKERFVEVLGANEVNGKIEALLNKKLQASTTTIEEAEKIFQQVHPDRADKLTSSYKMNYYRQRGDRDGYANAAIEHLKNFPSTDAGELSEIAYTFSRVMDDPEKLQLALGWAKQACKLEKRYLNYDALASVYHKMGEDKKAKCKAKKAIRLAKKYDEDYSETEALLKQISETKK